jgi:hypothetical protein
MLYLNHQIKEDNIAMESFIYLAVALGIGLWMYSDAKKRNLKQPTSWLWIGILFSVIGLATYCYWHVLPKQKV